MSDIIDLSVAANNASLLGLLAHLDEGPDKASLEVYSTSRPAPGVAAGGDPLVTIGLARPAGALVDDQLRLLMDDPGGYQVLVTGAALWGRLKTASGAWFGDGDISDADGDGAFKLAGTGLYAGGYVVLGTAAIV